MCFVAGYVDILWCGVFFVEKQIYILSKPNSTLTNKVGLTTLWVCNPPPTTTTGKLLDQFQNSQEADFRHVTLF